MTDLRTDAEPIEIAKFWANRRGEAVIVRLIDLEGRWFFDARRYYTDKHGKFAPTAKGLTLSVLKLPEFVKAITKAEAEARNRGLLDGGGDE